MKARRTCDELGLCQAQFGKPRCRHCIEPHPFAPGVVQVHRRRPGFWRSVLALATRLSLGALAFGTLIGYAAGRGWV